MQLPTALAFSRQLLAQRLGSGGRALDATAGNGYDTKFLAEQVGSGGLVWAFDIQQAALDNTAGRLREAGLLQRVRLIADSHARLADYVDQALDAAVFNFGYLPGGDKGITTNGRDSVTALQAASGLLRPGGLIAAVVYEGHPAGKEEARAVRAWAQNLPQEGFHALTYGFTNQKNHPPFLLAVEKRFSSQN
ncbi:MAG: class I SAM-dependent methyltransferase [Neisseria sp.]|nr:class I SAM-dependent methyltransferase [Neisseria sp.]